MRSYKLPSGKITKSADRYVREWRMLGKKLVKALGGNRKVYGFDPDFAVAVNDFQSNSESYSVWLALRIIELYEMATMNTGHRCKKVE